MYNLHHTEGIILKSAESGEADRIYTIYTKDFGKIMAHARGVRFEKSKLRGHLNLFSMIRLSFIEGKDVLRLTDAEELSRHTLTESNYYHFGRMSNFLDRLIRGQEKDERLWELIFSAFQFLTKAHAIPDPLDLLFEARVLHRLGYVSSEDEIIVSDAWFDISNQQENVNRLQKIYSEALAASQL